MADTPGTASSTPTLAGDRVPEMETPFEHLAIRSVDQVHEYVDSRLSLGSRPSPRELEEGFPHKLSRAFSSEHHSHHHHDKIKHEIEDDDNAEDISDEKKKRRDEYSEKGRPEVVKEKEDILYVSTSR